MWEGGGRLPSVRTFTIVRVRPNNVYPYTAEVVTTQEYALRETKSANQNFSRALNWFYRQNATLPWTELEFLRWPLVVGNSWDFTNPMSEGAKFEWHVSVAGWEEVTVPAGKFKTVVVKAEGAVAPHYTQSRTLWYSPDAKRFVKQEFRGFFKRTKVMVSSLNSSRFPSNETVRRAALQQCLRRYATRCVRRRRSDSANGAARLYRRIVAR